jgi:bifunctional non-homologous end joining protein LigD
MRAADGAAAGARVRLFTRRGFDWSERFPAILEAGALPVASASLDAEAVVCGDDGIAEFDKLHSRRWDHAVILYAFDLIEINGDDLRQLRLEPRKAQLDRLLARASTDIRFN